MNLLVISPNAKRVRGFTLFELLLVIALTSIILLFTSPVGISFYQSQLLNETSDALVDALRQAQNFAISGKSNQAFGVRIFAEEYVIFQGDTYANRTISEDQVFPITSTVEVMGIDEIVFTQLSGIPSVVGTLAISLGVKETRINILPSGNIER